MIPLLLRVVLLAALLVCSLVRINAFSLIYLLLFFIGTALLWRPASLADTQHSHSTTSVDTTTHPLPPPPIAQWSLHPDDAAAAPHPSPPTIILTTASSRPVVARPFRRFLLLTLLTSLCILLAIASTHITAAAHPFDSSSNWYPTIGLYSPTSSPSDLALLFVPDVVVALTSAFLLLTLHILQRAAERQQQPAAAEGGDGGVGGGVGRVEGSGEGWVWLQLDTHYAVIHFVAFLLLLFVGIVDLSILSLLYYVAWLCILCLWSCTRPDPSPAVPLTRSPSHSALSLNPATLYHTDSASISLTSVPPNLTGRPSFSLPPITDMDEKADDSPTDCSPHSADADDSKAVLTPPPTPPPTLLTPAHTLAHTSSHEHSFPPSSSPADPAASPLTSTPPLNSSAVFTVPRLHLFYQVLSLYLALDLVVRYVYRLMFRYDDSSASLAHVGFYVGVDGVGVGVGLAAEYALILVLFGWVQTVVHFHDRYICLPLILFPSLRLPSSHSPSPAPPHSSPTASPSTTPLPSSPLTSLSSYHPPALYYRLSRVVIGYSFILMPVICFCLALYYDILPAVIFLAIMALTLLLPSPLSLLLTPLTLLLLALFNVVLYTLYLPSSYWDLASYNLINHPWWQSTPFALLSVTSVSMLYVGFVMKYKVMPYDRWTELLVWRDVERESREVEREQRQRVEKEQRARKEALRREARHQRQLREAQLLQEEEEWEVEWARLSSDGSVSATRRKKKSRWWSPYTSRVGRLKLRFRLAALARSSLTSTIDWSLLLFRLLYLNADLFAIILLYIVGVMETDILHSIAMLLFIVYAISNTARQSPFVLVLYSSLIILILFLFQFYPLSSHVGVEWYERIGLIGFGDGYKELWPFVGLLIFGSVFFWRNPYTARWRASRGMDRGPVDEEKVVHESAVQVGLVVCEVMMLWAGCANSLQSLTSLSISLISGIYFIFAFVLLVTHQFALTRRYDVDRVLLFTTATYAGLVICVSYLYQLHAFDSSWLEYAGLARGQTWRVLLTHSVVLFVCAYVLRMMRWTMLTNPLYIHAHSTHQRWVDSASSSWQRSLLQVGFLLFLFLYWLLMLHTDKFLVITLFLAAIHYVSVMGAWYILCAFAILLVPGWVWLKSTVVMLSAISFVLVIFIAQIPISAFTSEHDLFTILGLRVNTASFGVLVVVHLAVMLMARLYMASDDWHEEWKVEQGTEETKLLAAVVPPGALSRHSSTLSAPVSPASGARVNGQGQLSSQNGEVDSGGGVQLVQLQRPLLGMSSVREEEKEGLATAAPPTSLLPQHVIEVGTGEMVIKAAPSTTVTPATAGAPKVSVTSPSAANHSWVVWLYRGVLLDSSSFFHYVVRFARYFSFYHLTLIACMIAAYDNASTIFGLAFTVLAGLVLLAGQARVNAWWGWLVLAAVLEVVIKYALAIANLQSDYSCSPQCTKWQQYWAHDDHLHDWDVVVLILAGVHYSQMQLQTKMAHPAHAASPHPPLSVRTPDGRLKTGDSDEEKARETQEDELGALQEPPSSSLSSQEEERRRLLYVPAPPAYVEVSHFRWDQSLVTYRVHDFTRRFHSSSAVCHFLVFRCLLYLVLFFLLSVSTCYFNVIASIYLTFELALLFLGDSLLERPERAQLFALFEAVVYVVYLLRFLYLIPVFDIATTATAWSTVLGFYHVHDAGPLPAYAVSGVVGGVLYIDIIMMVLLEVQRTVLGRPEMVFVRCAIARKRLVAELRRAKVVKKRREQKEQALQRLQQEQRERVQRLHDVQSARLIAFPAEHALVATKAFPSSLDGHPWAQPPAPIGSRGAVNSPLDPPAPTAGSDQPRPDDRDAFAPPTPAEVIRPEEAQGKAVASTASDDQLAAGIGAQYTVAALTAQQRRKSISDFAPQPTPGPAIADPPLVLERRNSRYGPPRLIIPDELLQEQWQRIQRHGLLALHSLPDRAYRGRVWLWWRLTNNGVVDFFTDLLGLDSSGWKARRDAIKRRKWQRLHEERGRQRAERQRKLERRRLRQRRRVAGDAGRAEGDWVEVHISPSFLSADEVNVSIAPSLDPVPQPSPTDDAGSTDAPLTGDAAVYDDDPLVCQRLIDRRHAPSLLVQLGQLWRLWVDDWSFLWVCLLFFVNYWAQPSLLSVVYPVTLFCFALLVNPRPPSLYWQLMILYTATLIFFRLLFQYPVFALCASVTSAPYYTTQSDLSNPACNDVIGYNSDGSLVENIAGIVKVTGRPNAESGWFWTFMSGTLVDWLTLTALLVHRKASKDDGLWYAPLLLTPQEEEEQREKQRRKDRAERRRRREQRVKERKAREEERRKRRTQEARARQRKVQLLARLLHKQRLTESEQGQKRRLEEEILAGSLRQRRSQPRVSGSTEANEGADERTARLLGVNSVRELEAALREQQEEEEDEEERSDEKEEDDTAHGDGNPGVASPLPLHRRRSIKLQILEPVTPAADKGGSHAAGKAHGKHSHHHHRHHRHHHHAPPNGFPSVSSKAQRKVAGEGDDEDDERWWMRLYQSLNDGSSKVGKDFYAATFILQLVLFLVVLIFYNLQSNIVNSVDNNYIPLQFVLVMLAIFMLIVFERITYLYQSLLLKFALQLATLICFFVIAIVDGLLYSTLLEVVYCLFAIYWLLSAQQFYWGFPLNTQGKALMRSTSTWYSTTLTIYRTLPFVFELQNLLDWACTRTTLSFGEWLILEDVLANFFFNQCSADSARNSPKAEGTPVSRTNKWLIGVSLFALLVLLLFGPLFLFSSQNATTPNPVTSFNLRVEFDGFQRIFTSDQFSSNGLDASDFAAVVAANPSLLSSQDLNTLQFIYPLNTGNAIWQITPGAMQLLMDALTNLNQTLMLNVTTWFTRSSSSSAPIVYNEYSTPLTANVSSALAAALQSNDPSGAVVVVPSCYPRYLYLSSTSSSITGSVDVLYDTAADFNTCELVYHAANGTDPAWWEVLDGSDGLLGTNGTLGELHGVDAPPLLVFSQRLPSSSTLNLGLVAFYVTVVLAVGKFLRVYVQGNSANIIYNQIPDPSVVLTMCKDLYSARLLGQLVLEEQLYVAIINLLRSPELLLRETGAYVHFYPKDPSPPPSPVDDEDDEEWREQHGGHGGQVERNGGRMSSATREDGAQEEEVKEVGTYAEMNVRRRV